MEVQKASPFINLPPWRYKKLILLPTDPLMEVQKASPFTILPLWRYKKIPFYQPSPAKVDKKLPLIHLPPWRYKRLLLFQRISVWGYLKKSMRR